MFSVIFDMDGTLLDTQKIILYAWEDAGLKQGIAGIGAHVQNVGGMNREGWDRYLYQNFPTLDVELFNKDFHEYISANIKIRFRPGAEKLMEFLDNNGIKYAIASGSSAKSVEHHLKELGVYERFAAFACGNDVKNGKPAPDVFLLAAERLGAEPGNCFVFEDSSNGVRAAHAAGMKVFGFADIAPFAEDVGEYMIARLEALDEAIDILKEYI